MQLPDFKTVYAFSALSGSFYGFLVFNPNGLIVGYNHPNERQWMIKDGLLTLCNEYGVATSVFRYCDSSRSWTGNWVNTKWPMILFPVLENLKDPSQFNPNLPKVFVNTLPKSGTYFCSKALAAMGIPNSGWHLGEVDVVDDYSELSDSDIHKNPLLVRIKAPIHLACYIMHNGQHCVGHVSDAAQINAIRDQGIIVLSIVRNIKDVLVSLYNFSLTKVKSTSSQDNYWKTIKDNQLRFTYFMQHEINKGFVAFIGDVVSAFLQDANCILLKYEDMRIGDLSSLEYMYGGLIPESQRGFFEDLAKNLIEQDGAPTSTLSQEPAQWQKYWNDEIQELFVSYNLHSLNQKLGYDA